MERRKGRPLLGLTKRKFHSIQVDSEVFEAISYIVKVTNKTKVQTMKDIVLPLYEQLKDLQDANLKVMINDVLRTVCFSVLPKKTFARPKLKGEKA